MYSRVGFWNDGCRARPPHAVLALLALLAALAPVFSHLGRAADVYDQLSQPPRLPAQPGAEQNESLAPPAMELPPADSPVTDPDLTAPDSVADDFQFGAFLNTDSGASLSRVPDMFGDSFFRGPLLSVVDMPTVGRVAMLRSDLPLAAATRRVLVAEHNKAIPVDRVYFNYNHFHNALQTNLSGTGLAGPLVGSDEFSVDQYTLGWEKTFAGGCWSAELRLPIAGQYVFDFRAAGPETASLSGGEVGNLAVLLKRVLRRDHHSVLSAGIGIDVPTGDEVSASTNMVLSGTRFSLNNDAAYVLPFVAAMSQPDCRRFWHTFVQLDIPVSSHTWRFETIGTAIPNSVVEGEWDDQTLLHMDVGLGYWFYRQCRNHQGIVTGMAGLLELHYTTALDDTDIATTRVAAMPPPAFASFDLRSGANRIDVVNVTAGLHCELSRQSTLRVSAGLPLRESGNRWFDAEIMVQMAHRF